MALPEHFLILYGYVVLFGWVLIEQLGVPLPATPVLLAAGAMSVEGDMNFLVSLAWGLLAALMADCVWFYVGRRYGHSVLRLLCRISIEPTSCVRTTQDSYGRRRKLTLLYAKFIPGLATLAPPIAGQNGMRFSDFLIYDGIGSLLWVAGLLGAGRLFGDALERDPHLLDAAGNFSAALLALGIVGFLVGRVVRRRMLLAKLEKARLEPFELKARLDAGEEVCIVDLRHPLELVPDPYILPGALHLAPQDLATRHHTLPRDREVILYCSCPSEATAAKTAMTLHKLGIDRVRPLRGGYDEWKRLGYPLEAVPPVLTQIS